MKARVLPAAIAFLAALTMLPWLTMFFIPDATLLHGLNNFLAPQGLTVTCRSLGRPFPVGISAQGLTISDSSSTWLQADRVSIRLRPLHLLLGRLSFSASAAIKKGNINGVLTLKPKIDGQFTVENLELADIPLLATATGGKVKGKARIDITINQKGKGPVEGSAKLQIRPVELQGAKVGSMQLPDLNSDELRGVIKLNGQNVIVDNLALQGKGIYIRMNGTAAVSSNSPLNINLDLMPTAEFMETQKSVFLLMLQYQTTPGNYRLPISGTINSPQLAGR